MKESLDGARSGSVLCDGAVGCDDEEDAARHSSGESEVALGRKLDGAVEKDDRGHVCKENVAELDNDVGRGGVVVEEARVLNDVRVGVARNLLRDLKDLVLLANEVHVVEGRQYLAEEVQASSNQEQLVGEDPEHDDSDELSQHVRVGRGPRRDEEVAGVDEVRHDLSLFLLGLEIRHLLDGELGAANEPSSRVREDEGSNHAVGG
mmetsp:Transcript_16812/g.33549  ORF Transcript_16812/g.33549 Transcript_16812/m.33549 type:complete len:206 (-) Transcript_16812:326-943(-)